MTPSEHFVQIYRNDEQFVETLAEYVTNGLTEGQACIVISTPEHREKLHARLIATKTNVVAALKEDLLIYADAQEMLARFMVDGQPDERLFQSTLADVLGRARRNARTVRLFGEMVALMWAQGHRDATMRLEHLWSELCERESCVLFCAYPALGFGKDTAESIARVCRAHSKILAA